MISSTERHRGNSLGKELTHNFLSQLRSMNEYLVIDWDWARLLVWQNDTQQMCTCGRDVQSQGCTKVNVFACSCQAPRGTSVRPKL